MFVNIMTLSDNSQKLCMMKNKTSNRSFLKYVLKDRNPIQSNIPIKAIEQIPAYNPCDT